MFGLPIHTVVYLTSPPEVVHTSRSESLPHRSHECTYPRSSYAFPSSRSGAWQCWRAASVHAVLTISAVGIQQPAPRVFRCCRGRRFSCFTCRVRVSSFEVEIVASKSVQGHECPYAEARNRVLCGNLQKFCLKLQNVVDASRELLALNLKKHNSP